MTYVSVLGAEKGALAASSSSTRLQEHKQHFVREEEESAEDASISSQRYDQSITNQIA